MTSGGIGRILATRRIGLLAATALAVLVSASCSSTTHATTTSTAASQPHMSAQATDCSTSVSKALVLTWGTAAGRNVTFKDSQIVSAFLGSAAGHPEETIYRTYLNKGVIDIAKGRAEKGNEPADELVRYAPDIRRDCAAAYE
ncbi:hypothetical protein ACWDO7_22700 [Streptomyces sp. NPDC003656]